MRLRPLNVGFDEVVNPSVPDLDKAPNVLCVVLDNGIAQAEDVHRGHSEVGDNLYAR